MRFPDVVASTKSRATRPATWGAALLFGGIWNLLWWGTGPRDWALGGFLLAFLLGGLLLVFSPIPWQWTGDDRPVTPLGLGLIIAAAWNLLLVSAALALLPSPPGHWMMMGRPGRGMMMGPPAPFLPPWQIRIWVLGLATIAFGVFQGKILAQHEAERLRAEAAERHAREAQTRALQAQMNPHVLFNAISGLAELAREDGPSTEAALVKLAELLRRLLDHAGQTSAPLTQERDLVEGLLSLEQFRLGDRLKVKWIWDAALERLSVPPLLLQPLVENAIKHGIAPNRAGGELEIGLSGTSEELRLWVANTGVPYKEDSPMGMGLSNLRQRLSLMRGEPGQLTIGSMDGRTLAELRLRLSEASHA
jgi:hypothetical protein